MTPQRSGYIDVDALQPEITLEQAAAYYDVPLPELHRVGNEVRCACFLNCGKPGPTGDRSLAINLDHPAKQWKCYHGGCGKSGNLMSLCDFMKPGENHGGRPRGRRFKAIAADLQTMVTGEAVEVPQPSPPSERASESDAKPAVNVPLKDSDNERARALMSLNEQFLVEVGEGMNAHAAAYLRKRPFLTPEVCRKWRIGYLPQDAKSLLRGKIVYPILSVEGDVLTWFGRDPQFERKHLKWTSSGEGGREPAKASFVKGFQRGLELFGQQKQRLREPGYREALKEFGLIVVEGPNDVIRLDTLGVPAVGLCANTITAEQAVKVTTWSKQLAGGRVTLLFDCDGEGDEGAKQALWELGQHGRVQLAWSSRSHGGKFKGREPESLAKEEWGEIAQELGD